ncbi:uncharacterized protein LOC124266834 [Haliotis rubra]|uniref:uncharacterized protein LOC124266834 n=1 Tax=Haliotis rubra TaxID=36100 RepID=UPI001EE5C8BE|nr:uncharacterized protein LOC124266834 [Haliotis rubra]
MSHMRQMDAMMAVDHTVQKAARKITNRRVIYEYIDLSHLTNVPEEIEPVSFNALLKEYSRKVRDGACVEPSCPAPQSTTLEENLRSVLSTMSERNLRDLDILMRRFPEPPTGKRTMFVTATSSNHFYESQALIRNLHRNVFPLINNYTFVLYDLGLTASERKQANLHKADILVWMDASVRFSNNIIKPLLDDAERRGMVLASGTNSVGQHTLQVTMNYMKEDVCTLAPVLEHEATFIMFHNKQWVREAVVKPWAVCAVSDKCMCPRDPEYDTYCNVHIHKYKKCHRYDQTAINIILAKLFRDHTSSFLSLYYDYVSLLRGDTYRYFDELEEWQAVPAGRRP